MCARQAGSHLLAVSLPAPCVHLTRLSPAPGPRVRGGGEWWQLSHERVWGHQAPFPCGPHILLGASPPHPRGPAGCEVVPLLCVSLGAKDGEDRGAALKARRSHEPGRQPSSVSPGREQEEQGPGVGVVGCCPHSPLLPALALGPEGAGGPAAGMGDHPGLGGELEPVEDRPLPDAADGGHGGHGARAVPPAHQAGQGVQGAGPAGVGGAARQAHGGRGWCGDAGRGC